MAFTLGHQDLLGFGETPGALVHLDKAQRWVSNAVVWSVLANRGSVIIYLGIIFLALHLFYPSGMHLLYAGQDVFLTDLLMSILEALGTGWVGSQVKANPNCVGRAQVN